MFMQRAAQYAMDVRDGKRDECRLVKLAVERWFNDLETGHQRGLYFDENAALRYFRFIGRYCRHSEGEWAGQLIDLEPWQCFIEANIHGWVREDGTRRFRVAYEEVARKNGKTLRMAANGCYYLAGDNEAGPQVYSAATKREQAREIFEGALSMVRQDRTLSKVITAEQHKLKPKNGRGKFVPLSKDSKRMDGFNVHAGLIDELHAHKDGSLFNVVRSGTSARSQPIMRIITTAGFDRKSFCFDYRAMCIRVLEGLEENDSLFAIIYTLDDPDEDWQKPEEWHKANPMLGVSVKPDILFDQLKEAQQSPEQKNEFLTKRLNVWTFASVAWMNMEKWKLTRTQTIHPAIFSDDYDGELLSRECFGGLDLSAQEDITSFCLAFPEGNHRIVVQRSYITEDALKRRYQDGNRGLESIVNSGELVVIPGAYIDQDVMQKDIESVCARFNVQGIAYDRWNASQLIKNCLDKGLPMIQFGQGFASMSAPMKEVMRLVLQQKLSHNDAMLDWAMPNVVATKNPAGDIKPDKSQTSEKIDPIVAMIMALALAIKPDEENLAKHIETHGVRSL